MPITTTVMQNGLRVVTETMPHAETVAFSIGVGVGSRDETKDKAGISHFVEHMLFKGTKTVDGKELDRRFDFMAASHNAATSQETTLYTAEVLPHNVQECFSLLADMVQNPRLDEKDMNKERRVILEELHDLRDMPDEVVASQAYRGSFPKQPLGREIIGKTASIKKMKPSDLQEFFTKHYRPDNMVISMAGGISHEQAVAMVAEQFHTEPLVGPAKKPVAPTGDARFQPVKIKHNKQALSQSYCHMIYALPNETFAANSTALAAYDHILSGCAISRLNQKLREKEGMVYGVHSNITRGREHCLLEVSASTSPRNMNTLCELVTETVAELGKGGITEEELQSVKNQAGMQLVKAYQDPSDVADTHCELMLVSGRTSSKEEDMQAIAALTVDQVNVIAKKVAEQTPSIALLTRPDKKQGFGDRS